MDKNEFAKDVKSVLKTRTRITESLIVSMLMLGVSGAAMAATNEIDKEKDDNSLCSSKDNKNQTGEEKRRKACALLIDSDSGAINFEYEPLISSTTARHLFEAAAAYAIYDYFYPKHHHNANRDLSNLGNDGDGGGTPRTPIDVWVLGNRVYSTNKFYENSQSITSTPTQHLIRGYGQPISILNKGDLTLVGTTTRAYNDNEASLYEDGDYSDDDIDFDTGTILSSFYKGGIFGGIVEHGASFVNDGKISFLGNSDGTRGGLIAFSGSTVTNNGTIYGDFDTGVAATGLTSKGFNNGSIVIKSSKPEPSYGMFGELGGAITNNGTIDLSDIAQASGMFITDLGTIGINNGDIVVPTGYALMEAYNGATMINKSMNLSQVTTLGQIAMVAGGSKVSAIATVINEGKLDVQDDAAMIGLSSNSDGTAENGAAVLINSGIINMTATSPGSVAVLAFDGAVATNTATGVINATGTIGMGAMLGLINSNVRDNVSIEVTNDGLINVDSDYGMYAYSSFNKTSLARITNNNKIVTKGESIGMGADGFSIATNNKDIVGTNDYGMMAVAGGTIINNGNISGSKYALMGASGADSTIINNNLDIKFDNESGAAVEVIDGASFINRGSISGTATGLWAQGIDENGIKSSVINNGIITAKGHFGIVATEGGIATNTNTLNVYGSAMGLIASDGGEVVNNGNIDLTNAAADANALFATGENSIATNNKDLTAAGSNIEVLLGGELGGSIINTAKLTSNEKIAMSVYGSSGTSVSFAMNVSEIDVTSGIGMQAVDGATAVNTTASITSGTIKIAGSGKAMSAENGGLVENRSLIDLTNATANARALYSTGEFSSAVNKSTIDVGTSLIDIVMEAEDDATITNIAKLISNDKIAMKVSGSDKTIATNDGIIDVTDNGQGIVALDNAIGQNSFSGIINLTGNNSVGMSSTNSAKIFNLGQIRGAGKYGMYADNDATISNSGHIDITGAYGMYAEKGGHIINTGNGTYGSNISDSLMYADGVGTTIVNESTTLTSNTKTIMKVANGATIANNGTTIGGNAVSLYGTGVNADGTASLVLNNGNVLARGSYGLYAELGALAVNTSYINVLNSAKGIVAFSGSTATNEVNGIIDLNDTTSEARAIYVEGLNSYGINLGTLNAGSSDVIMEARNEGNLLNSNIINANNSGGMLVKGIAYGQESFATNNGVINVTSGSGLTADAFGVIKNNTDKDININGSGSGMIVTSSTGVSTNDGNITLSNKSTGIGMLNIAGGEVGKDELVNSAVGTITASSGMGMVGTGLNTTARNSGNIFATSGYGMVGTQNAEIINEASGAKGIVISDSGIGMVIDATGGNAINNGEITLLNATSKGIGMAAIGAATSGDTLVNSKTGVINIGIGIGMAAKGNNISLRNRGTLNLSDGSGMSVAAGGTGSIAINGDALDPTQGTITVTGTGIAMTVATSENVSTAEAKNYGYINLTNSKSKSIGMKANGIGAKATNYATINDLDTSSNIVDVQMMNAVAGGEIVNESNITTYEGVGMSVTGIDGSTLSTASNKGTITLGMLGSTDPNSVAVAMISNAYGKTTNELSGTIKVNSGHGMQALSEGEAYNYGTINVGYGRAMKAIGYEAKAYNFGIISGKNIVSMESFKGGYVENNSNLSALGYIGMQATGDDLASVSNALNKTGVIKVTSGQGMVAGSYGSVKNSGEIDLTLGTSKARAMVANGRGAIAINDGLISSSQFTTILMEAKDGGMLQSTATSTIYAGNTTAMQVTGKADGSLLSTALNGGTLNVVDGIAINAKAFGVGINDKGATINVDGLGVGMLTETDGHIENRGTINIADSTGSVGMIANGVRAVATNTGTINNVFTTTTTDTTMFAMNGGRLENNFGGTINASTGIGMKITGTDANNRTYAYNVGTINTSNIGIDVSGQANGYNGMDGIITATGTGTGMKIGALGGGSNVGIINVEKGNGVYVYAANSNFSNGGEVWVGGDFHAGIDYTNHDTGVGLFAENAGANLVNNGDVHVKSGIGIYAKNGAVIQNAGTVYIKEGYGFIADNARIIDYNKGNSCVLEDDGIIGDAYCYEARNGGVIESYGGFDVNWHTDKFNVKSGSKFDNYAVMNISSGVGTYVDGASETNLYGILNILRMQNLVADDIDATHPANAWNEATGYGAKVFNGSKATNISGKINVGGTGIGMGAYNLSMLFNQFKIDITENGTGLLADDSYALNTGIIQIKGTGTDAKAMSAVNGGSIGNDANIILNGSDTAVGLYASGTKTIPDIKKIVQSMAVNNANVTIPTHGILMLSENSGYVVNALNRTITINGGIGMQTRNTGSAALNLGILNPTTGTGVLASDFALGTNDTTGTINVTGTGSGLWADEGGQVINNGTITTTTGAGMKASGALVGSTSINNNIINVTGSGRGMESSEKGESENSTTGVIAITSSDGIGMYATGDDVKNYGTIFAGNGTGMQAYGVSSSYAPSANNYNLVKVVSGIGMSANSFGVATNNLDINVVGAGSGIVATNDGTGINDSTITLTSSGKGMVAKSGVINTTVTNNGNIILTDATTNARAMYAEGVGTLAINNATLTAGGSEILMEAAVGGASVINNDTKIINANAKVGMYSSGSNSINQSGALNNGIINVTTGSGIKSGAYGVGLNSTIGTINVTDSGNGMYALANGIVLNENKIIVSDAGIGIKARGNNAEGDNESLIDITYTGTFSDDSVATFGGIIGSNGAIIKNKGTSSIINASTSIAMYLSGAGTATNEGTINTSTGRGMVGQGTTSAVNVYNKGIINVTGAGIGMKGASTASLINIVNQKDINLLGNDSIGMNGSNDQVITNDTTGFINMGNGTDTFTNITGISGSSSGISNLGTIKLFDNISLSTGMLKASAGTMANANIINVGGTYNNGMYATNGTINNDGTITLVGDHNYGMYAKSAGVIADNKNRIDLTSGTSIVGIYGETGTLLKNTGVINVTSNSAIGIVQNGVSGDLALGANNQNTINVSGTGTGMVSLSGGLITNSGTINIIDSVGMNAKGFNTSANNSGAGTITITGIGKGMVAETTGIVTNNATIDLSGASADARAMYATGVDSNAYNANILTAGTSDIVMEGQLGATITNSTGAQLFANDKIGMSVTSTGFGIVSSAVNLGEVIVTTGKGMVANPFATVSNNGTGIVTLTGTGVGLYSSNGGTVTNNATINVTGGTSALAMQVNGVGASAINNGAITTNADYGMVATNGATATLNNGGTITGTTNALIFGEGLGTLATNNADITVNDANTRVLSITGGANGINNGNINIAVDGGTPVLSSKGLGSDGTTYSTVTNKGTITSVGTYGMMADAGGYALNSGTLTMAKIGNNIMGMVATNTPKNNAGSIVRNDGTIIMNNLTNDTIGHDARAMLADGKNTQAINDGVLDANHEWLIQMEGLNGGSILNRKTLTLTPYGWKGMSVKGIDTGNSSTSTWSTALNTGTINVAGNSVRIAMTSEAYGLSQNDGTINVLVPSGVVLTANSGFGMIAEIKGKIINNGIINVDYSGNGNLFDPSPMLARGSYSAEAINNGEIITSGKLYDIMRSQSGGTITNNNVTGNSNQGLLVSTGIAMNIVGGAGKATNNGTITITDTGIGIKNSATSNGSLITNNGTINITGFGTGILSIGDYGDVTNLGDINVTTNGTGILMSNNKTASNGTSTDATATITLSGTAIGIFTISGKNSGLIGNANNYGEIVINGNNYGMYNDRYSGNMNLNNYGKITINSNGRGMTSYYSTPGPTGSETDSVINQTTGTIDVNGVGGYAMKGESAAFSFVKYLNKGTITLKNSNTTGMIAVLGQTITNTGTININALANTSVGIDVSNTQTGLATNSGIINVYGENLTAGKGNTGMKVAKTAINSGTINVLGTGNYGVYVKGTGNFTNDATGKINLYGFNGYGIYAEAGATINNLGTITNGLGSLSNTGSAQDTNADADGNIRIKTNGAITLLNSGTLDFSGEIFNTNLNTGNGDFVMTQGASLTAKKVEGEILVDSDVASLYSYEGTSRAAITTDELIASIKARAAMFDAWYQKNLEKEKAYDLSIKMKDYRDVVTNENIANYLQKNYDSEALKSKVSGRYTSNYDSGSKAKDRLYNTLNSTTTKEGVNLLAGKIVGNDYYPTTQKISFESEKFVNDNIDKNVISKVFADDKEVSSYLGTSQTASKVGNTDTTFGYNNNLSSIAYGNSIKLKNGDKLGGALSVNYANAKFDDSDSSTYKFTNYQANLFYGKKLKNGVEFVMSPYYAIGKGDIERKLYTGESVTTDANTHSFGMTTTARKTYNFGSYYLTPVLGISTGEIVQEEIKDESEDGTTVSATTMTTFKPNVEVAVGKVFTVKSDYKVNASTVAKYSYELGDNNKAGNGKSNADSMLGNATLSNTKYETNDSSGSIGARIGVSKGNFEVYTDYSHGVGTRSNEDKISGGFSYKF